MSKTSILSREKARDFMHVSSIIHSEIYKIMDIQNIMNRLEEEGYCK